MRSLPGKKFCLANPVYIEKARIRYKNMRQPKPFPSSLEKAKMVSCPGSARLAPA
jgi:hypothetical protein